MDPVAPVTPETPAPSANPLASMTPTERSAWKADDSSFDYGAGKPAAEAPTPKADSSPAQPGEQPDQAASTDASSSPASEPGQTDEERNNAPKRVKELLKERGQLEERLKALEAKLTPSQEPPKVEAPKVGFPDFETWHAEHPTEAYEDYIEARIDAKTAQKMAVQQAENSRIERLSTWTERLNEAKKDPAFIPKLSPAIANLRPVDVLDPTEPVTAENIIAQEVIFLRNPSLMVYLSEHPEDFDRIRQLPTSAQIIREMGRLDERVTTGTRTQPVAPKLITSASPPPRLVNQRPAEGADPIAAAVNSGDFKAFKAAEDAADRARLR